MSKKAKRKRVFIIAEAGVNHNGNLKIAKKMVDVAVEAGADAVKFQTFKAEEVVARYAKKAKYQQKNAYSKESQFMMLKRVELDEKAHWELLRYCRERMIIFLSTPFDLKSIDLLNKLGLKIFKIPSGEITNFPYLNKIGKLKKRIILSTGMSDLKEIRVALDILNSAGTSLTNIIVLHCNTEYPTPMKDVNLLAMLTIEKAFGVNIGYSDHTLGIEVPIAAVALGASVIEKHFTLDRNMAGPDHQASLEPGELKAMVFAIRNIEQALGSGKKRPSRSERKNIAIARKSLVAAKKIEKGELFTVDNVTAKRPGNGVSPMNWDRVVGKVAKKNFEEAELIKL